MNDNQIKAAVIAEVDSRREELAAISKEIHDNPETGMHEVKASALLTRFLEKNGFQVERGICQLPTAFRASYGTGKPAIAILAEYDALPEIGHACGHNIIATSAVGAAVAAKAAVDSLGGTVLVVGTPAEELYGGKIIMAERGAFEGLDAAMMVHPGTCDCAITWALGCLTLYVKFFGKAAHAAAHPEEGINALDAMLLAFNSINALRQHIKSTARIHGIITHGGEAANVIPAYTEGEFLIRDEDDAYLDQLKERVVDCFKGAALATGARLEYRWGDTRFATMWSNTTLAGIYRDNMESLGRTVLLEEPKNNLGSTDTGNVSHIVPTIHPYVALNVEDGAHTIQFAEAAVSETGTKAVIDSAKAMAMTITDLLASKNLLNKVKEEFKEKHG